MALSEMSSREKTIVAVLGVVILIALIGIGILLARLLTGDEGGAETQAVSVTETTSPAGDTAAGTEATITPVEAPSLEDADEMRPPPSGGEPSGGEPVIAAQEKGVGPLAPVIMANQPLQPGRQYRFEITAADGSEVAIQGSWGQSATSASGEVAAPQIEFFEGNTPLQREIVAPVKDPELWSCSISAAIKGLASNPPALVITIWDITGSQ